MGITVWKWTSEFQNDYNDTEQWVKRIPTENNLKINRSPLVRTEAEK